MFTTLISLAVASLAVSGAVAEFTVSTPAITECQPLHISWDGATGAVDVAVMNAADACGVPALDLGEHSNGALTVPHSFTVGQKLIISALDEDDEAWSGEITVAAGNCTNSASASVSASASGSAVPSGSSASGEVTPTTLVIPGVANAGSASPSSGAGSTDDDGSAAPIGAVNNGLNGALTGGASTLKYSGAAVAMTALAAVFAISF